MGFDLASWDHPTVAALLIALVAGLAFLLCLSRCLRGTRKNPGAEVSKAVYHPLYVYRESDFKFSKGSEIYLLDAPNGEVYVMQWYTNHFDKTLTREKLAGLGNKLRLPPGWKFRAKVLERDLVVSHARSGNIAEVLRDDLHNAYEGSNGGRAFNFIP